MPPTRVLVLSDTRHVFPVPLPGGRPPRLTPGRLYPCMWSWTHGAYPWLRALAARSHPAYRWNPTEPVGVEIRPGRPKSSPEYGGVLIPAAAAGAALVVYHPGGAATVTGYGRPASTRYGVEFWSLYGLV